MYLDVLDPETRSRGLVLSSWGVNEVAWDRHTVLQVIAAAANAGLPILGGDVWRADASGWWRPTGENWFSERHPGEDMSAYVERSRAEAIAYLGRYSEPPDGMTRYVVVCGAPG
jgi:hypothetical protein